MRIVVTGGTGFVGRSLVPQLAAAGHDIVLQVRSSADHHDANIAGITRVAVPPIDDMSVADWRPMLMGAEAVIHLAAIAHIGPSVADSAYSRVNRDATARLAEAAMGGGVRRFVFLSSIRAQVGATSPVVQDERTPPAPTEAYGRSKLEAESLVRKWLPQATILRPALIVGPEPKGNLLTLLKLADLPLPLPFGGLHAPQAMISMDGLIDAVQLALGNPAMAGETYCLADMPHLTLTEMITALRQGIGRPRWLLPVPARLLALPLAALGQGAMAEKLTGGLRVDSAKLTALGWRPRENLSVVLQRIGASRARC